MSTLLSPELIDLLKAVLTAMDIPLPRSPPPWLGCGPPAR
jgi:hypothetical protein